MNKEYYINVREVMIKSLLPKPRKKRKVSVITTPSEWLPIIDGDTGKVVMV